MQFTGLISLLPIADQFEIKGSIRNGIIKKVSYIPEVIEYKKKAPVIEPKNDLLDDYEIEEVGFHPKNHKKANKNGYIPKDKKDENKFIVPTPTPRDPNWEDLMNAQRKNSRPLPNNKKQLNKDKCRRKVCDE